MIKEIRIVFLPVTDQQRALEFWRDAVGFEVREDYPADPPMPRWLTVSPAGAQTCFALLPPDPQDAEARQPGGEAGVSLISDDLKGDFERMSAAGVEFTRPPKQQPYGLEAGFADPDGNVFNVVQPG